MLRRALKRPHILTLITEPKIKAYSLQEAYTKYGIREYNNPFLYIVLPKHLRKSKVRDQLLKNSEELITHHDLHSTLKDILYFQPESMFTNTTYKRFDTNPRGSSLLREFESGTKRNCLTLPIPFQYCICQYERKEITMFKIYIRENENGTLELDGGTFRRLDRIDHKTGCIDVDVLFGVCTCKF
ncbi:hypothetical protein COOONC_05882 [Cooperia oncophora]